MIEKYYKNKHFANCSRYVDEEKFNLREELELKKVVDIILDINNDIFITIYFLHFLKKQSLHHMSFCISLRN